MCLLTLLYLRAMLTTRTLLSLAQSVGAPLEHFLEVSQPLDSDK